MYKKIVDKYIKDVKSGKVLACKWVKLAIDRNLKDLKRKDIYFDEAAANKFLKFSALCKYTKGELASQGKTIELTPQQVFRYWVLMGWMNLNGKRRFRKVYFEVARKNGKSEEAAILCAYFLLKDNEFGAEIYTAATKHEQAKIVFLAAQQMIIKLSQDYDSVQALVNIGVSNVSVLSKNSKLEPLSSRSEKQDGLNPHLGVIDEYHAHKNSDLLEVIQTGMGSRNQPMLFIITTAGTEKQFPCYSEERKIAIEVLQGIKTDDSLFSVIYTLDEGDDWKDEKVWIKSNPNIGLTPTWEYMRQQLTQAINQGVRKETQFKTKNLNIWTNASSVWINDEDWMLCDSKLPDLKGRECFGGLDLATKLDMNAYVLLFPPSYEGEKWWIKPYFWLPEATIERKKELGNYKQWERDGLIKISGIDIIDIDTIVNDIVEINKNFVVKEFAFDVYKAYDGIIQGLDKNGINGIQIRQAMIGMSEPTKELEAFVRAKRFGHGGNDILRWQMGNVEIRILNDMIHMEKSHNDRKIDGLVALGMALGAYRTQEDDVSVYESRGLRQL